MAEQEPYLMFSDGSISQGIISDWSSAPVIQVIKNKPLKGRTRFKKMPLNDQIFNFTITFSIPDCGFAEYQKFSANLNADMTIFSEWGGGHPMVITKVDPEMVIENVLYKYKCEATIW